jgi:hypothetical protein
MFMETGFSDSFATRKRLSKQSIQFSSIVCSALFRRTRSDRSLTAQLRCFRPGLHASLFLNRHEEAERFSLPRFVQEFANSSENLKAIPLQAS